ncbi:BREX-1 system adenine-specific DNA-methyltransferase PglX [Neptunomonas concharum]|uniref:site-specific DNA-methyltransferase (adenine-specific) n=1 Tax=Neptunomonas concharum TaxID=1031538 RepID=A0A5P1RD39_9GAMM|nr:BREX-1 system adenine-specific DNA-methyltransferase PglX [Neptunomonas concharum]QEQ97548.1 BREX-1 system adenine-specific DNA-methyltransferase PglX [Neptunomonas concharum]
METSKLKKFAQFARRSLIEQVGSKLAQVLKEESSERRELPKVVAKLEGGLKQKGKEQLIEQVAYVWFNRFCALRFMDVNGYNRIGVLSPAEGQFQPEILAEAKAGHIDEGVVNDSSREKIFGLLNGSIKSRDGQSEAYRLLIVSVCNDYHRIMPYLFERIEDYTELLMPDDLLSGNSILAYTREAMTPEACESVECIGWLYQFYISEKKDQVFEGLKKNKKITPENIPAATQLFTPHWIVRYLVENSLGRLWMLNNPSSKVIEQMEYYIKPVEEESDYLKITSPEEIKVCDPACGSGHMLTYAYDLLYSIYLDAGYDPVDIPELILTKNLYGIEIDERAAELAAFALSMKALKGNPNDDSNNRRRFFRNPIKPNVCRIESIAFNSDELNEYIEFVGRDLFTQDLRTTLKEFEEADNFGSLIQPTLKYAEDVRADLDAKDVSGQLFLAEIHKRVLRAIDQADYLSQKYNVVVANPPYMGGKGMNPRLAKWAKDNFPDSKSDLFAMFIERDIGLTVNKGFSAMINMQSWMFLSSFERLRHKLLRMATITSMCHLGARAFDSIGGEVVSTTAYVLEKGSNPQRKGHFVRLVDGKSEAEKARLLLQALRDQNCSWFYTTSSEKFRVISGCPIAYWISSRLVSSFKEKELIGTGYEVKSGLTTGDNEKYLFYWHEVGYSRIYFGCKDEQEYFSPHNKGGEFRKWYGNIEYVLKYGENNVVNMKKLPGFRNDGVDYFFREMIGWSKITSDKSGFRYYPEGLSFNTAGLAIFSRSESAQVDYSLLGFLNTKLSELFVRLLNPTMNVSPGIVKSIPFESVNVVSQVKRCVEISKIDWDCFELSMDFRKNPLLEYAEENDSIAKAYKCCKESWEALVVELQQLEVDINTRFINAYDVEEEVSAEVSLDEITLNINPEFKYSASKESVKKEKMLKGDAIRDFISYSVGCMHGRYSLDGEGLVIADRSKTLKEFMEHCPRLKYMPDEDNVTPMIDFEGDWFEDDISERFKEFLKVTFGEEHFVDNLVFVEEAIGKDIKKYFVKDFYADHVKRYKKRPIYWLFSSPKGTFNALIYMHRYRSDTVSVVLNDYLREFRTKLQARKESYEQVEISGSSSPKEKTQAIKAIDKIKKVLDEVNDYERDILYPLAGQNIEIDLDDGVKANYPKFGKALKKIAGLS